MVSMATMWETTKTDFVLYIDRFKIFVEGKSTQNQLSSIMHLHHMHSASRRTTQAGVQ